MEHDHAIAAAAGAGLLKAGLPIEVQRHDAGNGGRRRLAVEPMPATSGLAGQARATG